MTLIAAIDQGTTSTRCIIINPAGDVLAQAQYEHEQIMRREGWVEHDPIEIWRNVRRVVSDVMVDLDVSAGEISALGVTNQRETAVIWEKSTGRPIYNAIVWQDTRTADQDIELTEYMSRTGLLANSYPAGPKWAWILNNVEGARERAERGELLAGTIDTWLMWQLTGGAFGDDGHEAVHATDVTNASRTMLMDIRTCEWDAEICADYGIPLAMLPEIKPSIGLFGHVRQRGTLAGVPITGVLGDQQAALFGQNCLEEGEAKMTYGTGLFMLLNTGDTPHFSKHGLLTTVAYQQEGHAPIYATEGSVAVGGSLIQWLRDQLGIISTSSEIEVLAREVSSSAGVTIVPAFSGLFAPRWRADARGVITGLTRFADKRHIARAALEATCLQTLEVTRAMEADTGIKLTELRVDGGMTANELLMQMQADILDARVVRPGNIETTAMGAASAAAVGAGVLSEPLSLGDDTTWASEMTGPERDRLIAQWEDAVTRSYGLA
ncbi:glycerol kinase GlpK [Corynebacterium sp. S7]